MTRKWTPEMEVEFAEAWRAGVSTDRLESLFRIGHETLVAKRRELGLMPRVNGKWTEARITAASTLWIEGKSATQIAMTLNCGLSRNAVIGKIHRLGLSQQGRAACAAPAPDLRKRLFAIPKVARSHVRPPKPGPQNKPAVIHGDYAPSTDAMRLARAAEGRAANDKVAKGVGVDSPNARPWMERKAGECNWTIGERFAIRACCNPVHARGWCAGHHALGVATAQPRPLRTADARGLARHDRVEMDQPRSRQPARSVWDDARQNAA